MEKITEIFTAFPDVLAVFHKNKAADVLVSDADNTFYILYKNHPSCGQHEKCTEVIKNNTGGSFEVHALNDVDLMKKDEIFLNYHIIYNADQEKTQEYISKVIKAHAAYKKAATASLAVYQDGFEDLNELNLYYNMLAIPFVLMLIVFLVSIFTKQEKQWPFFFGMFTLIFFVIFIVGRLTRFLDKFLILFYSGRQTRDKQKDYSGIKKLVAAGNIQQAVKEYRKQIAREPEIFELNFALAELLEKAGDFRGAVLEYQKSYMKEYREDTLSGILYHMGELYLDKLNDRESALKNFKRVAAEYPESASTINANSKIAELEGKSSGEKGS